VHRATDVDGAIGVFDFWRSTGHVGPFGETLGATATELGFDPGEPQVATVHNARSG